MATHPLEVPEIVALVGHFLPLWTVESGKIRLGDFIQHDCFRPGTFHACFLVNKLWYRTLLPILWSEYLYQGMEDVPPHIIEQYSVYFRRFDSYGGVDGPFNCTSLKSLTMAYDDDWMAPNMSLQAQTQLVRMNPGLESLQWDGPGLAPKRRARLDTEDFQMLDNLRNLQLDQWDGSQGLLVKVLRAVAKKLVDMDIQEVFGFQESDLTTMPQTQGDDEQDSRVSAGEKEIGLEMPRVKTFRVHCFSKNTELILLAGCCPNLQQLELDFKMAQFDATRLAGVLRDRCSQLHTLKITDNYINKDSPHELLFGLLIRDCSLSGLTRIEVSVMRRKNNDRGLFSSISRHAATLEHLVVDYYSLNLNALDVRDILGLLVQCRRLRILCVNGKTALSILETLDVLKSEVWGCSSLERLDLDLGFGPPDKQARPQSDNTLANISSTTEFMGWYCHAQKVRSLNERATMMPRTWLGELFRIVEDLERLQVLTWCEVVYSRSPDPS
ncbi:hypothetical protein BGW39_007962 [Mortierella sp. 14UC]|nr:hypothetical protein BGW39_007962 [Mortierella sp. 14UC]